MVENDWADTRRWFELLTEQVKKQGYYLQWLVVEDCSRLNPPQINLLAAVAEHTESAAIYLPHDPDRPDLYSPIDKRLRRLGLVSDLVTTFRPVQDPDSLAARIFSLSPGVQQDSEGDFPSVTLWNVPDEREQNSKIAEYLKKKIKSGAVEPGDCCVVLRNASHRKKVSEQLARAEVPMAFSPEATLLETRLGQTIESLVDAIFEPNVKNISRVAASPYFRADWYDCAPDDVTGYDMKHLPRLIAEESSGEEIVRRLDEIIRSLKSRNSGDGDISWNINVERVTEIEQLKKDVVNLQKLLTLENDSTGLTWPQVLGHLHRCLTLLGMPQTIKDLVDVDRGYSPELLKDMKVLESLQNGALWRLEGIIGQIAGSGPSSRILNRVIKDLLNNASVQIPRGLNELSLFPQAGRGVHLVSPIEVSAAEYSLVIIPYMVDGVYPAAQQEDWLENELFQQYRQKPDAVSEFGQWSDPRAHDRGEAELFFRCTAAAKKELLLVQPLHLGEEPAAPSPYPGEINSVWSTKTVDFTSDNTRTKESTVLTSAQDLRIALVRDSAGRALHQDEWSALFDEGRAITNTHIAAEDEAVLHFFYEGLKRGLDAESQRWGPEFGRFDGMMKSQISRQKLENTLKGASLSVTALNRYAACPFSLFCEKILSLGVPFKLEEEISALYVGQIYHHVLEQYYRECSEEIAFRDYSPDAHMDRLEKLLQEYTGQLHQGMQWLPESTFSSLRRRAAEDLQELLNQEYGRINDAPDDRDHLFPYRFELRFKKTLQQLVDALVTEDMQVDRSVVLQGKVDRIDRTEAPDIEDRDQMIVFDYKLGSDPPDVQQIKNGQDLQMPLYILAARTEFDEYMEVKGGGYISMRGADWSNGLYTRRAAQLVGLDNSDDEQILSQEEFEKTLEDAAKYVEQYLDAIFSGIYPVAPAQDDSCRYCSYSEICRQDRRRLRGKEMAVPERIKEGDKSEVK